MKTSALNGCYVFAFMLGVLFVGLGAPPANAIPSFQSPDSRLPNPDRPYEMVGRTVHYDSSPHFAVYDLEFVPRDPSQLDFPTRNPDGSWEFDSKFDIAYKAVVSISTQPPHTVSGIGTARARGFAPADPDQSPYDLIWPNPQVFDSELVELNLWALSPIPEIMLRESPTLRSRGVIIREDTCPMCLRPFTYWDISSFFDIASEVTFDGGNSWTPANDVIHVEQAPDGFPPGDYNKDNEVDGRDYVVWRSAFGQMGAGLAADGDWSGEVDAGDFEVMRTNFGHGSASPFNRGASVPEPVTLAPLLLAMLTMLTCRRGVLS